MVVESRFRSLYWSLFGIFLLYGTSMTIIGATLPRILSDFHWDYVTAGAVMAAGGIAYFVSTFGAGYLVGSIGAKATVLLGVALELVGLAFFGATPDPLTNFLLSFLIGLGQGCIEVSINWGVVRLDTLKSGSPMTYMQGAFAIGAIVGPILLGVLLGSGGAWTLIYRGLAAVFLLLGVVLTFLRFDLPPADEPDTGQTKVARLYSHPAYWMSFVVLFLYVGVELGVSSWVSEFFIRTFQLDASIGSILVSLFWTGILVGRFGVPVLLKTWSPGRTLTVFTAMAALFIVGLSALSPAAQSGWALWVGFVAVFGAGLGCSIVYPVVITLVSNTFPQAQGKAIGFAATGGGVGAFLFPFVMSLVSQAWGIQWGFAAYAGFALLMTVASLVLVRVARH